MKVLYAVTRKRGPAWDYGKGLREQPGWDAHAAFMNHLAAEGIVVLGGPIGDQGDTLLAFRAANEEEIQSLLARDPWGPEMLVLAEMRRWTILLEGGPS